MEMVQNKTNCYFVSFFQNVEILARLNSDILSEFNEVVVSKTVFLTEWELPGESSWPEPRGSAASGGSLSTEVFAWMPRSLPSHGSRSTWLEIVIMADTAETGMPWKI